MPSSVIDLVRVALDSFDSPGTTVSCGARRAMRIATLRKDYANLLWLQFELTDRAESKLQGWPDPAIRKTRMILESLLGREEGDIETTRGFRKWERNRLFDNSGEQAVNGASLGQIEQSLALQRQVYGELTGINDAKAELLEGIYRDMSLLERVKSSIHGFLVGTEMELAQGGETSTVFHRAQVYINGALQQLAPAALAKFVAAQESMYGGGAEDLSHALTSCRRMLKALADALHPATGDVVTGADGVDRKMSDDAYRNRLLQYVREQVGGRSQGEVVQDTLDSLGQRLKSLDSLASKGVHDEVSAAEAETCVVWTYLLAADIVRIADGTSSLLGPRSVPEGSEST